jgi:hypothetical protein
MYSSKPTAVVFQTLHSRAVTLCNAKLLYALLVVMHKAETTNCVTSGPPQGSTLLPNTNSHRVSQAFFIAKQNFRFVPQ